jgi:hypothetical protein
MKFTVSKPVEIDVAKIRMFVAVRYDDEDMPYDFPFRKGDGWAVTIDAETGQIQDWPQGIAYDLHMKVVDCGSYFLLDAQDRVLGSIEHDYVPDCIPGEYGDYIDFKIDEGGKITNWNPNFTVDEFFPEG